MCWFHSTCICRLLIVSKMHERQPDAVSPRYSAKLSFPVLTQCWIFTHSLSLVPGALISSPWASCQISAAWNCYELPKYTEAIEAMPFLLLDAVSTCLSQRRHKVCIRSEWVWPMRRKQESSDDKPPVFYSMSPFGITSAHLKHPISITLITQTWQERTSEARGVWIKCSTLSQEAGNKRKLQVRSRMFLPTSNTVGNKVPRKLLN